VWLFPLAALALQATPARAAACGTENLLAGKLPHFSNEVKGNLAQLTDGTIGEEGAMWDSPVVVRMASSAAELVYDLGEARQISALLMQGDANDVYPISGSLDGTPGSFTPLGEFPNAVSSGHGLRTRAVEIEPATVRFLRLAGASGDGFFSISELAAYCSKPSPFPPALNVVASPIQPGNGVTNNDGAWRTFGALYTLAGLALVWLAYRMRKGARVSQ
jgi:hypothetical protein